MIICDVLPLFPQIFVVGKLPKNYDIIKFLKKNIENLEYQNFKKTDCNLHKRKEYKELCDDIITYITKVFNEVYLYDKVTPYITLMWGTASDKNDFIHRHYHPNSFISGVYYPQDIDYAPIKFHNPIKKTIEPLLKSSNILNANSMVFTPQQGDIFLFPSTVEHQTQPNHIDETRYSISFNIFLKGKLGLQENLSSLTL